MTSMSDYRRFLYEDFTLGLAVPIVVLNIAELTYIIRKKLKRSNNCKATLLVMSLCMSDLLLGINMIILKTMHRFMKTNLKGNETAQIAYDVIRFGCIRLSFFLSTLNLAAITCDRYSAMTNPFKHRSRSQMFIVKAIIGIWIAAITITALMYLLFTLLIDKNSKSYMNLLFPIPTFCVLILFIYCYVRIYFSVKKLKKKLSTIKPKDCYELKKIPTIRALTKSITSLVFIPIVIKESDVGFERMRSQTVGSEDIFVISREERKMNVVQDTKLSASQERLLTRNKKIQSRLLRLAVVNVALFSSCWCPLAICCCMKVSQVQFSQDIFSSFFVLANINALFNPIAYYFNIRDGTLPALLRFRFL